MTSLKKMARSLLEQVPGRFCHLWEETGISNMEQNAKNRNPIANSAQHESSPSRLQILYLRRVHGLTEAQAQAVAALVWGAM